MSTRLTANIDVEKLKQAWQSVVSTHDMLRTGFIAFDDHKHYAMIVYTPEFVESSSEIGYSNNIAHAVYKQFEEDRSRVIGDLMRPPWHLKFFRDLKTKALTMLLTIHHAIYDARSMDLVLKNVEEAYNGQRITNQDNIHNLLCYLTSQTSEKTIVQQNSDFWTKEYVNANFNKFPSLTLSTVVKNEVSTVRSTRFDKTYKMILEKCRTLGVSAQAVAHIAWAKVLGAYLSETDVVFGSGRICIVSHKWQGLMLF